MRIVKDLTPPKTKYRFTHYNCCIFEAAESEFKWTTGRYNEKTADVVCPKCGRQFYYDPDLVVDEALLKEHFPLMFPNTPSVSRL